MPSTTDRPDGSDDPFAVAEAALDAPAAPRETVPVERATEAIDRPTGALEAGDRPTVLVDDKKLGAQPTVKVPGQRKPPPRSRRAPLPVAVAFATLWAAALSYLPVAAVIGMARTLEGQGGLGGAAHAGLAGWLLGHGVPIGTSAGSLGLPPLLLTGLIVWRLNRAGLHVTRAIGARRSGKIGDALLVAFSIGLTYSLLGSVASLAVDGRGTDVTPARAAINFFLLGLLGSLAGSVRGTDALSVLARRTPRVMRDGLRTGVMAALFILAAGAAAAGLSVAFGGGQAADTISVYHTGVAGQAGITLLSLAYGGNAAVWAAAYLLGPGFALGTGSEVGLTEVMVGKLPALPLLAGVPDGPMGAAGAVLLAVPVLAGMAAGWLLILRLNRAALGDEKSGRAGPKKGPGRKPELPWSTVLGGGLLAGPVAGLVLGVMSRASSGPLGDGRLATIGPDPWQVALVATIVVALSASLGAAAARTFAPAPKS
ncbi:cell division protein PerM [Paractinoplanes durhamensis]|uniref:cell division protein PerM n=1 Tax=Paractinoplanes durhamensis TaxID=113563 RepID=UPI0031E03DDF